MYYKDIDYKNTKLYKYSDLSEEAKVKARNEVLQKEVDSVNKHLATLKVCAKHHINDMINNRTTYKSLVRHKRLIKKLLSDLDKFKKFIEENFCNFLNDGTYITYLIK